MAQGPTRSPLGRHARPSRVKRLRRRRVATRAQAALVAGIVLALVRPSLTSGIHAVAVPKGSSPARVQGSGRARALEELNVASGSRPGRQHVGVWVAEGLSARMLGFLRSPAEGSSAALAGGLRLPATMAVTVVLKGKAHDVITDAATVGELLSAMGIEPDGNDRVAPPLQTPLSRAPVVRFARVDVRRVAVGVVIPFRVTTVVSHSLAPGMIQVQQVGRPGRLVRTYLERFVDGRLVVRRPVSTVVTARPADEVRLVGAAPAPAPPAPTPANKPQPPSSGPHWRVGDASWYYHPGMTAASPWLPFGTSVKVTNLSDGRTVTVVINDRGPFGGRIIDLSEEAFSAIAPLGEGVVRVRISW